MKALTLLIALLPSLVCSGGAVALLLARGPGADGWGWLLFAGVLMFPALRTWED